MPRHALLLAAIVALALITWLRIRVIDGLPDQGYFAKYLTFADRILAGRIPRKMYAAASSPIEGVIGR